MFKNRRDMEEGNPPGSGMSPREGDAARSAGTVSRGERTVIGEQISIEGSIRGKENLLIEGSLKGNIELEEHQVTVGSRGQVEAEIHAKDVTISGRMTGNIRALGKVQITREAEFNGEIKARGISVEDGAYIKAVIELEREPQRKAAPAGKPDVHLAASKSEEPLVLSAGSGKGK